MRQIEASDNDTIGDSGGYGAGVRGPNLRGAVHYMVLNMQVQSTEQMARMACNSDWPESYHLQSREQCRGGIEKSSTAIALISASASVTLLGGSTEGPRAGDSEVG